MVESSLIIVDSSTWELLLSWTFSLEDDSFREEDELSRDEDDCSAEPPDGFDTESSPQDIIANAAKARMPVL